MHRIDNGGQVDGELVNVNGDIALVLTTPVNVPSDVTSGLLSRLAIKTYLSPTPSEKRPPVRELRRGWERVKREISVLAPNVKRVLVMCTDTATLRVLVPGLEGDLQDAHGTLFKLGNWVVVPTWQVIYDHMKPWRDKDVARLLRLERDEDPLPYTEELPEWLVRGREHDSVVVDIETNYPVNDTITCIGMQWSDNERGVYTGARIQELIELLGNSRAANIVLHNAQYDMGFFGLEFVNKVHGRIRDTMLRARARGEHVATLKHLGVTYTRSPGNYAYVDTTVKHDFSDPRYVTQDVDVTWRLWRLWRKEDTMSVQLYERLTTMMTEQTIKGSAIDVPYLDKVAAEGKELADRLYVELNEKYGCDVSSGDQLAEALEKMGFTLGKRTKTGEAQLTAAVLEEMGLDDIVEWRKARKLDGSFVQKINALLRADGTLPHRQKICAADTGRTSMSDFNWQQAGRTGPVRKLLVSRFEGGEIGAADLAQAELRSGCYYGEDYEFAAALNAKDMHRENASLAFSTPVEKVTDAQRTDAKTVIFRLFFGGSPQNAGQRAVEASFRSRFKKMFRWLDSTKSTCERTLISTSAWGKVRKLDQVKDYRGKWACGRAGVNSPIQSIASDWALWLTVRVWELFKEHNLKSLVIFGVHDAIMFDIYPGEKQAIVDLMRIAFSQLGVILRKQFKIASVLPLTAEMQTAANWADTKKDENKVMFSTNEGIDV